MENACFEASLSNQVAEASFSGMNPTTSLDMWAMMRPCMHACLCMAPSAPQLNHLFLLLSASLSLSLSLPLDVSASNPVMPSPSSLDLIFV